MGKKQIALICFCKLIEDGLIKSKLTKETIEKLATQEHYHNGRFRNSTPHHARSFSRIMMRQIKRTIIEKPIDKKPLKPLPIKSVSQSQLEALSNEELFIIKLGHSSILLKVYGEYWLIDPVFSERASPLANLGPKRFHPTPISIDELPNIDKVLISHNHYDHLDKASIKKLAKKTKQFLVPLGVDFDLQKWGVSYAQCHAFDWWQEEQTEHAFIAFTPARHYSGRTNKDRNLTLWGSWVIKTPNESLYFSGDSGYFEGFKQIGDKYGPFDLTLIESGAYNKDWPAVHMFPEESVQAHIDLNGKMMLPIHNSTFDLSIHPWYEPLERVSVLAKEQNVNLTIPVFGEIFTAKQEAFKTVWWDLN